MTRKELISLVENIKDSEDKTEQELDNLINILKRNVLHPEVTDLIYYNELTPEEIVDKALSYMSIRL
ncbi:MAG: bacteriocin immunity protein [Jejuia sp.]